MMPFAEPLPVSRVHSQTLVAAVRDNVVHVDSRLDFALGLAHHAERMLREVS